MTRARYVVFFPSWTDRQIPTAAGPFVSFALAKQWLEERYPRAAPLKHIHEMEIPYDEAEAPSLPWFPSA